MRYPVWLATMCLLFLALGSDRSFAADSNTLVGFRFPAPEVFRLDAPQLAAQTAAAAGSPKEWVTAWPTDGSTNGVQFGRRIVLQLINPTNLERLIAGRDLRVSRSVNSDVFILEASDAAMAIQEAGRLALLSEVLAAYPVVRRQLSRQGLYASAPSDSFFNIQWDLENRMTNGTYLGGDLNVRAAWSYALGAGVTVAVADTGIELNHIELTNAVANVAHTNFVQFNSNGAPIDRSAFATHGTEVAGVIAAQMNNARMSGVAPAARLASWVIFGTDGYIAADEQLSAMYEHQPNSVAVQNHSWGFDGTVRLNGPTLLEQIGISNAVTFSRGGKGAVLLRSAGNDRELGANANEDAYPSDPRVIAVGASSTGGRVLEFSEPGACVLVAAPVRDLSNNGLFTTDLLGADGINTIGFFPPNQDLSDYVFNSFGFAGTSAAVPEVAGIAALLLSANPNLGYRDVQHLLALAARHFDLADPDLTTNSAGLRVSHNLGFGVPDAGEAVRLAQTWTNRPPLTTITLTTNNSLPIPDDGLRVMASGENVPAELGSISCLPSLGPHVETTTATLPLVYVGLATNTLGVDLTNKAALIQRGISTFEEKIRFAAQAGAAFAVVYNFLTNSTGIGAPGGEELTIMGGTDFTPIPALFIRHNAGEALRGLSETNPAARVRIQLTSAASMFAVTNTLLCEHVGLRVQTDHPLRGDLRITLLSPTGTRSVLQAYSTDISGGPTDWTYWSTHHLLEPSTGTWTAYFADEAAGNTGSVQSVSLILYGSSIVDTDTDGLDDDWEQAHFGALASQPKDDPDKDGYNNAREQVMGSNPNLMNDPFRIDLARWNGQIARLSWPASEQFTYRVWQGTNLAQALTTITNLSGRFPEAEWFTPSTNRAPNFFRVEAVPKP